MAFYNPPSPLPPGGPGTLIWAQPIPAPPGGIAWRILYRSTDSQGKADAASGIVVAPVGKAPKGGRNVLAWAHGTVGGARDCAPSLGSNPAQNLVNYFSYTSGYQIDVGIPALTSFLKAGYVVAATDYQGLGTPGVHQYLVGGTEAHNVLDSVRAARQLQAAHAGTNVVSLGWSQGGGAAIWVNQDAAYGRPLRVLGSASLAPAVELGPQFKGQIPPGPVIADSPAHDAALTLNVFRGMHAAYPQLSLSAVLTSLGLQAEAAYQYQCNNHLGDVLDNELSDGTLPSTDALFARPLPADWLAQLELNTPGRAQTAGPILVMQGTADTVVNPNATTAYVRLACTFKQPVQFSVYAGQTHQTIPVVAQSEYLAWIADRFAGKAAPSNCGS